MPWATGTPHLRQRQGQKTTSASQLPARKSGQQSPKSRHPLWQEHNPPGTTASHMANESSESAHELAPQRGLQDDSGSRVTQVVAVVVGEAVVGDADRVVVALVEVVAATVVVVRHSPHPRRA